MKKFAELNYTDRTDPCQEYPGQWLVYIDGDNKTNGGMEIQPFDSLAMAKAFARAEQHDCDFYQKVSVCWSASDNDPRIGEVWFTGFYQWGELDGYGNWKDSIF